MPAWAADWITTPEEDDDEALGVEPIEEDGELLAPTSTTAKGVLKALAGGALAGLAFYGVQRVVERISEGESSPKRKRSPSTAKRLSGDSGRAAKKRAPDRRDSMPAWVYALYGVAEAAKLHEAHQQEKAHAARARSASARRPRARAAGPPAAAPPPPPPLQDEIEDDVMDARAAATLGVHVDATADQIGAAWRRLVRKKMAAGAFHDQPGANHDETAALISAKNRLIERARRRGAP